LQSDLWQFYLEPSLYGQEVFTVGGSRGPGRAYYVPLLSGLQLFCNMQSSEEATAAAAEGSELFQVSALPELAPVALRGRSYRDHVKRVLLCCSPRGFYIHSCSACSLSFINSFSFTNLY
jgi:hypothetical protein